MNGHGFRLLNATRRAPALTADDDAASQETLPWVLLERNAYVVKRDNATTARCKTTHGRGVQVTFYARRPSCVSYLCVYSPDGEIPLEPEVLAMEDDLVLLRICVCPPDEVLKNLDYFVYQADDGLGRPSLKLLPRPPTDFYFDNTNIGLLRCSTTQHPRLGDQGGIFLRPHGHSDTGYVVAGFKHAEPEDQDEFAMGNFDLCLYNSKLGDDWTTCIVKLNQQQKQQYGKKFRHRNSKVMSIGGEAGTLAFVDLFRGILFCDVLPPQGAIPPLRYVSLPVVATSRRELDADPCLARDIVLEGSMIKFLELEVLKKNSKIFKGYCVNDGWRAATYTRAATSSPKDTWRKEHEVDSNHIDYSNNPYVELLPKVLNDEDMLLPPFKRLDICQPTLGLHDDVMYLFIKVRRTDKVALVVTLDMKGKAIQGVTRFSAERYMCITLAFMHSRISNYLKRGPGTKGT